MISVSERTLKDAGDKVAEADRKDVEAKIAALKEVKDKPELDPIKKTMDELSAAIQKVGAAMYQQPGAQPGAEAEAPKQEQGPVDAEYKDVSSDKK